MIYEPIHGLLAAQRQLDDQRIAYIRETLSVVEHFTIGDEVIRVPRLALSQLGAMEIRSARVEMTLRPTGLRRHVLARGPNGEKRVDVSMALGVGATNETLDRLLVATMASV